MSKSNLAAYLAKNYLTASTASSTLDEPPKKKRKKSKHASANDTGGGGGLVIADDDEDLSLSRSRNGAAVNEHEDSDGPVMFQGTVRSAEFRKAKKNTWQSLSDPDPTGESPTTYADNDDANTFLRTVQSDEARRLAEQEAENAPAVVETDMDMDTPNPRMDTGVRAGLQTAADTARLVAAEEEAQAKAEAEQRALKKTTGRKKKKDAEEEQDEREEETVYRDATGRRIDISLRRAEARREELARQQAQRQEKIDAMGEVQRREHDQRRRDLDEAKFLTLGRGVEDEEYNSRLKEQVRWDDPMAAYMAEKHAADEEEAVGGKKGGQSERSLKKTTKKREYQGSAPPNRYGIKPGWRWDGVDRGNGFEKEWFQARSRRSRNEALSYEWQMDE